MRMLFVVAHPDDEVLGAGASIRKFVNAGHKVAVATMCNHAAARRNLSEALAAEQISSMNMLGITKNYSADFPNIKMNTVPHLTMVQFVEQCIEDFQAEAIFTHHPSDTNNDHVQTSYATQAAARLFQRKEGVPVLKQFAYMEVLSSTEWSLDSSAKRFTPNYFVEIEKSGVEVKLKALATYKDVMRSYPHPRSAEAISGLATYRGAQAGCNYAEAYEIVLLRG